MIKKLVIDIEFLLSLALIVEMYPKLIAVSELNGKRLSYEELWQQALNVSIALHRAGCKKNQLIAIQLEKSCDYVIALIGTWLAGCNFMILDIEQPESRLEFMCREAQPDYLLFGVDRKPLWNAAICICINEIVSASKVNERHYSSVEFRKNIAANDDQAYLLFTSGSSGIPKGVRVAHRGIFDVINEQTKKFKLLPGNKSLWLHSIAFDASISDIGTALLSASELCIIPNYTPTSTRELLTYIEQLNINFIDIPPALLQWMKPKDCPACLNTLVVGGEVCSVETLKSWAKYKRVIVVYGPTEATICTSMIVVDSQTWNKNGIGYPLKHIEYSIKSNVNEPYNEGELLIGGKAIALGYLNRTEIEAEKFVEHKGQRFYRTGDKVRKNADLSFEFLGRTDRQIKVNGKLVAPEEIESCLIQHTLVKQVAVVPWKRGSATCLIAYCEIHEGISLRKKNDLGIMLRQFLQKKLPSWLIPTKICFLDSLPLNQNQKTDYSYLKSIAENDKHESIKIHKTDWSSKVYHIFLKVLEQSSIDTNADFFEIGGDSMSIVAILSMAESEGVPLTAEIIYKYKSINNIVEQLLTNAPKPNWFSSNDLTMEAEDQISKINVMTWGKQKLIKDESNILLTGATGFFGAYVLWELLKHTNSTIHCLIRGEHPIAGVIEAMKQHGFCIDENNWKRIKLFSGDLEKQKFGLSDSRWKFYINSVDTIYHCAANVSILKSYEELKASNVEGTRRIIELSVLGNRKALHYVSTLSVFVDAIPKPLICSESDKLIKPVNVYGGYAQSKWVAEKMLHIFGENMHRLSIYRLGLLTGKLKNGKAPQQDWFSLILRGESIPDECISKKLSFDFTPVDYAAKALVHISLLEQKGVETYHIAKTKAVSAQLLAEVMADNSGITTNGCKLDLSSSNNENAPYNPRTLFKRSATEFDMRNTNKALVSTNIKMPVIDFNYIKEYRRKILETN